MVDLTADTASSDVHAPPQTQRRPRVREVSSRFMTPLIHSNSNSTLNPSDLPRSKSVQRRLIPKPDENHIPETNRSFDKPPGPVISTVQRKQHHKSVKQHSKENIEVKDHQISNCRVSSRPDTPIADGTGRVVSSRFRQTSRSNSLNSSNSSCGAVTAAARLLQEATGSDAERKLWRISTSSRDDSDACSTVSSIQGGGSSCPSSPVCVPIVNKQRSATDARSSMPDVDKWLNDRHSSNTGKMSDCARSLNFSAKVGGNVFLPPQHPSSSNLKSGVDVKKGKTGSSHQEDVHSLKMLNNRLLQWRFANAKAEACARSQKQEAEINLYSLGRKLSDMRDSVKKTRSELAVLRGINILTTIVESQMPYLNEWSTMEEEYSTSLSCTTNALLDSSARLPLSGNVKVDAGQLGEAMNSALQVMELIQAHLQRFTPNAEEMDNSVSELARMAGGERSLVEECGYLISKTYSSQVTECSLRSTLMQLHNSKSENLKKLHC